MSDRTEALRGLLQTAMGLARRTTSGTVGLSRVADVVADDMLPAPVRERARAVLDAARDRAATPLDAAAVDKALKAAWGTAPKRVVDDLDPAPLSVSGLAQVHAATLDGEPVVVKVARPGLAQAVRGELSLLDLLGGPLAVAFPALDAAAVLREVRETAQDELDLEHEGEQQARVRRALRRIDGVTVPAVHDEHADPGALIADRLPGETLAAGARPADAELAARRLLEALLTAWREAGLVVTDLRPSHVVVGPGDELGLLGMGVARPVDRERLADGGAAYLALADEDPAAFVAAVERLGVLGPDDAATAHGLLRDVLGAVVTGGELRIDGPALAAIGERAYDRLGDGLALAARATPRPEDLHALRMLGQLGATLARLEPTLDWHALARELLAA